MTFFKILLCFFFLFPASSMGGKNSCSKFSAKFPFHLQDQQSCGYPGFELGCNKQGKVTLNLPQSGDFFVRSIDYVRQEIRLQDPSGCVAKRLPKLNLSGSPFKAIAYMKFSFFSCSPKSISSSNSLASVVGCLSSSRKTVIATPSVNAFAFSHTCQELFGGPIRVPRSFQSNKDIFSQFSQLEDSIPLRWSVPGDEFSDDEDNIPMCQERTAKQVFGVISISVILGAFAVFSFVCFSKTRQMHSNAPITAVEQALNLEPAAEVTLVQALNLEPDAVTPIQATEITPRPVNVIAGLDKTTLESYARIVLGESCRIPGEINDDETCCPICWGEYSAKETIKCIPDCKHCFHADCIDQWFRRASTCPICRITPVPLPPAADATS